MIVIKLDKYLEKYEIKMKELSKRTNISVPSLSNLKNNKTANIRFSTLDKICNALNCNIKDLMEYIKD